eukprot:4975868-Pleurochrysis_carterae.AAC.5
MHSCTLSHFQVSCTPFTFCLCAVVDAPARRIGLMPSPCNAKHCASGQHSTTTRLSVGRCHQQVTSKLDLRTKVFYKVNTKLKHGNAWQLEDRGAKESEHRGTAV